MCHLQQEDDMHTLNHKDCTQGLLHMYIKTYSLFRSGLLSTNIQLTLYYILIRSVMTYAFPTWEYAMDAHFLKLQCLQKNTPRYCKP
jgi:hypothetical protein